MLDAVSSTKSAEDTLVRCRGIITGAEGKSDDQRTVSTERLEGTSTTLGGEERKEGTVEDGRHTRVHHVKEGLMHRIVGYHRVRSLSQSGTKAGLRNIGRGSDRARRRRELLGRGRGRRRRRPTEAESQQWREPRRRVRVSVIGESRVWRKVPTTDSV
jgi:hypothetical protein